MKKENVEKIEREYTIPLRAKFRSVPRYKKSNKAIKSVKEFIAKHMKVENRDLNKVKVDPLLNQIIWSRGIKNPIHKVKVVAIKEGEVVKVNPVELPKKVLASKNKLEKREKLLDAKEEKKKKKEEEKSEKKKDKSEAIDKQKEEKIEGKEEKNPEDKKENLEKKEEKAEDKKEEKSKEKVDEKQVK